MNKNEVTALISLLNDPDEVVYKQVNTKFLSLGQDVIPVLETAWEQSFDTILQNRIEDIIHTIQFELIENQLKNWMDPNKQDLLEGALLIVQYQYPDVDIDKIHTQLNQIKQDVWLELNDKVTALEKVKIINHILFDVHKFSGNTNNYHAPQNSYINNVLESKKGNPLLLSIIYMIIAQNVGIPIYGVNLPEHFILCYSDEQYGGDEALFYINPFSKGVVFGKKEVDAFIKQLDLERLPAFYNACSNKEIIIRLLNNLIVSYEKLGYPSKSQELSKLLKMLS